MTSLFGAPGTSVRALGDKGRLAVGALLIAAAAVLLSGAFSAYSGPGTEAGANVADSVPAANVVDAQCSPAPADCARNIADTIRNNAARPLKVTFGEGAARGTTFRFSTELRLGSNIAIEGLNQPVVQGKASTMFKIGGTSNLSFSGFDVDVDRCRSVDNVFRNGRGESFSNLHISDMRVYNGDAGNGDRGSCMFFRSSGTGSDLHIDNVSADSLRRVVWFSTGSNHNDVTITNMEATRFGYQALTFDDYVEDLLIESGTFSTHADGVKGSHVVSFSPAETLTEVKSKNVVVRNNVIEGLKNTPHIKIGGVTQPNGAAGDLLAIRGTNGFLVEGNIIRHSGEVGITITAGSRNGIVRNNSVSYTDTTGIVLGNGNTIRVTNIDIYNNDLFQNSLDRDGTHNPLPALSVWGATESCVVHNQIHDNTVATGLWVWNGHMPPTWPRSVKNMYITENTFSNNLYDFVQSSRPTRNFETASSFGGTNWTSTFGSPDADGDGFGAVCSSETDDNNPCEPFTGAAACSQPNDPPPTSPTTVETTTTTVSTTTAPPTTAPATTAPPGSDQVTTTTVAPPSTDPTTAPPTTVPGLPAPPPSEATSTTSPPLVVDPAGPPELHCKGVPATIIGTDGDDVIYGTSGRDIIVGLGGNDKIHGKIGPDIICGGEGDDELWGGRDNDYISGGPGNDIVRGGRNNDSMVGDDGDDTMFGNTGRDTMDGGDGADEMRGNSGRDYLNGGPGVDYLAGNRDRDILVGGPESDVLLGGSHRDRLIGGDGSDACAAGLGNDQEETCETTPLIKADDYDNKIDIGNLD